MQVDQPVALLNRVSKKYKNVKALDDVTLRIVPGEVLVLLGPNGAGKTTTVKLLLGLAQPTAGSVAIFGQDPRNHLARTRTGVMLQTAKVPETLRVREHIDLFSTYYPRPLDFQDVITATGLKGLENRYFGELSAGQKQRVLFALALCGNPDLLFLDEPTAGLDVEARRLVWEQIRLAAARGKTLLITTHYMEEAEALASRVVIINKGSITAEGTPGEIKAHTSGQRIRCVTSLSEEDVRAIPGVRQIARDRNVFEIEVINEPESVLRSLFLLDPQVGQIEILRAGLEEAFVHLTQEK